MKFKKKFLHIFHMLDVQFGQLISLVRELFPDSIDEKINKKQGINHVIECYESTFVFINEINQLMLGMSYCLQDTSMYWTWREFVRHFKSINPKHPDDFKSFDAHFQQFFQSYINYRLQYIYGIDVFKMIECDEVDHEKIDKFQNLCEENHFWIDNDENVHIEKLDADGGKNVKN